MSQMSVKVDQVAALRTISRQKEPDPSHAAVLAELAGADGITCHLREDRLYIRDRDLYILREVVKTKLTVQVAPDDELIERVLEVKPWMVTLMPRCGDDPVIRSGIDLEKHRDLYMEKAKILQGGGIHVGYFVNPDIDMIKNAARARIDAVDINAGEYTAANSVDTAEAELDRLEQMAQLATKLGLITGCSGGIDFRNIRPLVDLDAFDEFTVGHAVVSRAVLIGFERAVSELADAVHSNPASE